MAINTINEIMNEFDFTDSIITDVKWGDHLTALSLMIDYYWDLQEGRNETRILTLTFKDCKRANFSLRKDLLQLPKEDIHYDSWFTIVQFEEVQNIDQEFEGLNEINIYTVDYATPWLNVLFGSVTLEL